MKIQLDNRNQWENFDAMIDVITQTWSMDDEEQKFIESLNNALKEAYKDLQGRENTQGLIDKELLLD